MLEAMFVLKSQGNLPDNFDDFIKEVKRQTDKAESDLLYSKLPEDKKKLVN
jgi:hypothetical protein